MASRKQWLWNTRADLLMSMSVSLTHRLTNANVDTAKHYMSPTSVNIGIVVVAVAALDVTAAVALHVFAAVALDVVVAIALDVAAVVAVLSVLLPCL